MTDTSAVLSELANGYVNIIYTHTRFICKLQKYTIKAVKLS